MAQKFNEFDLENDDSGSISPDKLILIYQLERDHHYDDRLFRCKKFNRIKFIIGPSLYGESIRLKSNYQNDFKAFDRNKYTEINIEDPENCLQLNASGSFHFVYYSNDDPNHKNLGSFFLVVTPELIIDDTERLSVNAVQCQTILSKLMGPIDTWKDKLQVSINSHYNMIHWTPIQVLGGSNSAYSLADQHRVNQNFRSNEMIRENRDCLLGDIAHVIDWLRNEHRILSITDVVLNHTANESPWLKEHPESAYNCHNSPWLRSAFLLDRMFWNLSIDIVDGRWEERGIGLIIENQSHLDIIRDIVHKEYLPLLRLEEFYQCNIDSMVEELRKRLIQPRETLSMGDQKLKLVQDPEYRRLKSTVDLDIAENFIGKISGTIEEKLKIFRNELKRLNSEKHNEIHGHLVVAVDNVLKGTYYERLDMNGPKFGPITPGHPLTTEYFTDENTFKNSFGTEKKFIRYDLTNENRLYDQEKCCYYMAHNGWVMGDDPLRNFAEENSLVYLRRELICWGDSVKLRYGNSPDDSPFLWNYMKIYVENVSKIFHGLRLDNCHSTPINVAKYMIDSSRLVNENLYLIAELFTSNEFLDNIFINNLGINSLIRESLNSDTPYEFGRRIYYYGGEPVGSFIPDTIKESKLFCRPLVTSVSHAIFFDQTHDNESPIERRTAYDPLPTAALLSMTLTAIGSNRGYDELVPYHIHVVNEKRQYRSWNLSGTNTTTVNESTGIISARRLLNDLHRTLNSNDCRYSQAFVDQRDRDTIAVTRHDPITHRTIVLIARTAFYPGDYSQQIDSLKIEGKFIRILFETFIDGEPDGPEFESDPDYINGYSRMRSIIDTSGNGKMIKIEEDKSKWKNIINFNMERFPPSSVLAMIFELSPEQNDSLKFLKNHLKQFFEDSENILKNLNLIDMNYILFRCDEEERDSHDGHGTYYLSNGPLCYAGLAGIMFPLTNIRTHNDLGHPLCGNLRDGDWLPQYIVNRLKRLPKTVPLAEWLQKTFSSLVILPRYLIPRYFDAILCPLYTKILERIWCQHSESIRNGDEFIRRLALGFIALIGTNRSSPLPPLASSEIFFDTNPTMAAGLPHFSTGYMRNWGRDTFISLKGSTLLTGRFDVAKSFILGYAGCLRHGLIPNLLDGGRNPRYNCRDAVWWWLQAIKDYITLVPDGSKIFDANVRRLFPNDDSPSMMDEPEEKCIIEPLHKIIQEALQRHFDGIDFIERNAGKQIDAHMKWEGFHIHIEVDRETGFIRGGNRWNCGTWMDKMGSSDRAGNRGTPATPRDGSAVEIIGLAYSILKFLSEQARYPYQGVGVGWTWGEWSKRIRDSFEKKFFIDVDCSDQYVNRRGIYKDTVGASQPWMDYQLRPNFLIAMSLAPELFDRQHAIGALNIVSETLIGPLGVKTLDPSDWTYRANYDNSLDSDDPNVAHGFNYHNGPEWLWPMGHYLISRLRFMDKNYEEFRYQKRIMSEHYKHLCQSEWFGLPELTNENGTKCQHGCPIQCWSHATMLDAVLQLKERESE